MSNKLTKLLLGDRTLPSILFIIALALFCAWFLTGCITKTIYVTQTKYEAVPLPPELTERCPTTKPPDKTAYLKKSDEEKENTLATYSVDLIGDVAQCNKQITSIKDKQIENAKLVEKRNKDLKPEGK